METTRRAFIKKLNWTLAGIIGMLGFAGCDKIGAKEYASPHADYTVKGKVVNKATGKPIEGIRIGYPVTIPGYHSLAVPYQPKTFVLSNTKGEFKLTDSFEFGFHTLSVVIDDIDGEENGLFQPEIVQVDFKDAVRSGKSKRWYKGEYTVNMNIELTEIENE